MNLNEEKGKKYLEIVKSHNMDDMFDFGVKLGGEQAVKEERERILKSIEKLIIIHKQLSEEIVGNKDYHLGAIFVLEEVKKIILTN